MRWRKHQKLLVIQTYNRPGYTIEAGLGENPLDMGHFAKIYQDNQYILVSGMTQI